MPKKEKIFVAGHNGMIGSAIVRKYKRNKKIKLLFENKQKLNLTNQNDVFKYLIKKNQME